MPMTISMDDTLKREFTAVCKEIGLSPSTAINIFARAVVREKGIPFKLTSADTPSVRTPEEFDALCRNYYEHLSQELMEAYEEIKAGHCITRKELLEKKKSARKIEQSL